MQFSISPSTPSNTPSFRFAKIPILGNAGAKIDALLDAALSPYVAPGATPQTAPVGKVSPFIVNTARSSSALLRTLFLNLNEVNPSSAELPAPPPDQRVLTQLHRMWPDLFPLPEPQLIPVWTADP